MSYYDYYKIPDEIKVIDYTLIVDASIFPITLQEAKDYLKVDGTDSDAEITRLIATATDIGERITGRDFINKTYKGYLDCFPCDYQGLQIRKSILQSIDSIQYFKDGSLVTISPSDYYFTKSNNYSSIFVNENASWPNDVDNRKQAIEINFIAGYGNSADDVPAALKRAMLSHIALLFDNKGDCSNDCNSGSMITQAEKIYQSYIVPCKLITIL